VRTLEQLEHLARLAGPGGSLSATVVRNRRAVELSVWIGSIEDRPVD
jgi:hypothetical protein